jgi:DNA-binding phage protein
MNADDSRAPAPGRFDVADHLNHPAVVRAFLWNAVATGNPDIIARAEASIARAAARRTQHAVSG